MKMITRPMLACSTNVTQDDLQQLQYPVWVSDKEDGIRCLIAQKEGRLQPLSRRLITIPNIHIKQWAESEGVAGLDGEIIIPGATFHEIQSKVMTQITFPFDFRYRVFDMWETGTTPYLQRLQRLKAKLDMYAPDRTELIQPLRCDKPSSVWEMFQSALEQGKEGVIIRDPDGRYKQGRSTFNEQLSLKLKAYIEREAIIIDFEPEYENQNTQTKDRTGSAKRSSHQANLKPRNRVGTLVVRDCETDKVFRIGSGLSHDLKKEIWDNRSYYLGQIVTYKYQLHGTKIKPRTPIFRGVRKD